MEAPGAADRVFQREIVLEMAIQAPKKHISGGAQ